MIGADGLQGFQEMVQNMEQIIDSREILRHPCNGVTEAYIAGTGNHMNQIMRTVTIAPSMIAACTFIARSYGKGFIGIS